MLADAKADLFYPLGEGWEREPDDPIADEAKLEKDYGGTESGPKGHISMAKVQEHGIAYFWDLHHDANDMETVARFSNGYYGIQAVQLVHEKKGSRYVYRKCADTYVLTHVMCHPWSRPSTSVNTSHTAQAFWGSIPLGDFNKKIQGRLCVGVRRNRHWLMGSGVTLAQGR